MCRLHVDVLTWMGKTRRASRRISNHPHTVRVTQFLTIGQAVSIRVFLTEFLGPLRRDRGYENFSFLKTKDSTQTNQKMRQYPRRCLSDSLNHCHLKRICVKIQLTFFFNLINSSWTSDTDIAIHRWKSKVLVFMFYSYLNIKRRVKKS